MCRLHRFAVLTCLMAWLTGCSVSKYSDLLVPPFDTAGPQPVYAVDLWPVQTQERPVMVTDRGRQYETTDATTSVAPGVWRMIVNGFWVVEVNSAADGSILILSEVEQAEARRVEYDPPLPMIPAELRMNRPIEYTRNVRVYNDENNVLDATGEVTATYQLLGRKMVSPGGLLPGDAPAVWAYILQTDRRYKLPLVSIDMHIISAYEPGRGPIAGRTVRTIKLLGLLPVIHEQSVVSR